MSLAPAIVDLSKEGTADWAHWGQSDSTVIFNRKVAAPQLISDYTVIGNVIPIGYPNNVTRYHWTGGTPVTKANASPRGIFISGVDNGFKITIHADQSPRTLKLYVGTWRAAGMLEAALNDKSVSAFTQVTDKADAVYVVTIAYRSANDDETLTVKWTQHSKSGGNVTLQAATLSGDPILNSPPTVFLIAPSGPSRRTSARSRVKIGARAHDRDGDIKKVEFFVDNAKIGEAGGASPSINWDNVPAGSHQLTAIATDDKGASTRSPPLLITSAPAGKTRSRQGKGLLRGGLGTPPKANDLTDEGTLDWAHWGYLATSTAFNHKKREAGGRLIGNFTKLGHEEINIRSDHSLSPSSYRWNDGTPNANAVNTTSGVWARHDRNGFQLSVAADTRPRVLRVYVSVWDAQGKFEATLSDGSAGDYVDTSLRSSEQKNGVFTVVYRAGSRGQTLSVKWTVDKKFSGPEKINLGNIVLYAATLKALENEER